MNKDTILKVGGVVGVVGGAIALYLSGISEQNVMALVGGAFILAGIVMSTLRR